ncbi:sugar ABC transporter permease [Paenibacillus sp. N1-5-1-14]|uniref:carbohydrate ABC transporter permease n=1 Tax=Paenibacillus radicibacter TaxID=2972488 RepID=UPI0021594F57|nr:sugar ABC transporter permease [Paenibacillus radicibacter]MCR8642539.1 sugar ABC transporter permease [Paenibacillus radicibacter]
MATEVAVKTDVKVVRKSTWKKKSRWYFWGLAFLLPEVIIFSLFLWMPIIKGIIFSFQQIDFVNPNTFVGLDNYREILALSQFKTAIINTLSYMALCLVIGFWVPALTAICVSELRKFQGIARVIGYLPSIIPSIVLYGMWTWFYDPIGPINSALMSLHLDKISFFSNHMAMISIVIMETWQQFGAAVLIYLAGIMSIPKDLYEAAEIDGASVLQRIRHITLPGIKKLLALMLILQLINTSQGFQAQMAMTDGGPNNATLTYMLMATRQAFVNMDFGKASAMGVMMFIALLGLSFLYQKLQRRGVGHE